MTDGFIYTSVRYSDMDEADTLYGRLNAESRLGYGDPSFPRYRLVRDAILTIAWEQEIGAVSEAV